MQSKAGKTTLIKSVTVYNQKSKLKIKFNAEDWSASVFAEGGTLLEKVKTKIAVRLSSEGTLPSSWRGVLIDSLFPDKKILEFNSLDKNVAEFEFTPDAKINYQILIEDNLHNVKKICLPQIQKTGIAFSVSLKDSILNYCLAFNNIPIGNRFKIVGLIDNNLVYKANIISDTKEINHSFKTDKIGKGLLRLTVFDNNYHVVAERLCFISPTSNPFHILDSFKVQNVKRSLNNIKLNLDSGGYSIVW